MEFKGTKGNWNIMNASSIGVPFIIINDNDETIFQCYTEESEANSLLISKAPEMLEMLKRLIQPDLDISDLIEAENLIKEATEL